MRQKGEKIGNIGGITRKAIEEGWKKQKAAIEIKHEVKIKALTEIREAQKKKEEDEVAREQQLKVEAVFRYEALSEKEKEAFLEEFRSYLLETGDRIILERFEEKGISLAPVAAMFGIFARERLLGKK